MRTGMKRLFAAFAAGMLLFSTAFAQEDQELTEEDLFAQWDLEADETENVVLDENGEEHQVLSDAELAELDTLEDMGYDVERLRPEGKDWNDDLRAKRGGHG